MPAPQLLEEGHVSAVQLPQVRRGGGGGGVRECAAEERGAGRRLVLRRDELRCTQLRQQGQLLPVLRLQGLRVWLRRRRRHHGLRHSRLENRRLDLLKVLIPFHIFHILLNYFPID